MSPSNFIVNFFQCWYDCGNQWLFQSTTSDKRKPFFTFHQRLRVIDIVQRCELLDYALRNQNTIYITPFQAHGKTSRILSWVCQNPIKPSDNIQSCSIESQISTYPGPSIPILYTQPTNQKPYTLKDPNPSNRSPPPSNSDSRYYATSAASSPSHRLQPSLPFPSPYPHAPRPCSCRR